MESESDMTRKARVELPVSLRLLTSHRDRRRDGLTSSESGCQCIECQPKLRNVRMMARYHLSQHLPQVYNDFDSDALARTGTVKNSTFTILQ